MNTSNLILLVLVISIIVVVIGLIIYNYTMTPATQKDQIEYINAQLGKMILGYSPPS